MDGCDWRKLCREVRAKLRAHGRARIDKKLSGEISELLDRLKESFVDEALGRELEIAYGWARELMGASMDVRQILGISEIMFPRELGSFLEDPKAHLRKKLFTYAMDLARGRISIKLFGERGRQAVQTSLQTNLRGVYQSWVFLTLLGHIARRGGCLIYPEHCYLSLERSGRQRLSSIPPNAILETGSGALSFFLEAPRPVAWEDTEDLKRVWRLYKAMRPDILVYGGRVMDIFDEGLDPPIKRPDIIVECKELEDWHKRTRELKGGDKPLSAEEWRWMWLRGLWRGLGRELGARIRPEEVEADLGNRVRLKEPDLVKIYKRLYSPREMILVTRCTTPSEVKYELEAEGIEVLDDTQFDKEKLASLAEKILRYAVSVEDIIVVRGTLAKLIKEKSKMLGKLPEELLKEMIADL